MEISVGPKYRLVTDTRCWRAEYYRGVYKSGDLVGQVQYETIGWFKSLRPALAVIAHRMLNDSTASTPEQALEAVRQVAAAIETAFAELPSAVVSVQVIEPGD